MTMQAGTEKTCTKCRRVLPIEKFQKDRHKKGGRTVRCGECLNEIKIAYYWANRDARRAYFKEYKDNPKRRADNQRWDRERLIRDPEKCKARFAMNNAIRDGKLVRQPCHKCGDPKSQGHHHDYSKPLEVEWLCQRCHAEEHKGEQASPFVRRSA